MRSFLLRVSFVVAAIFLLSGCASIVATQLANVSSYPFPAAQYSDLERNFNFEKRRGYIYAPGMPTHKSLNFKVDLDLGKNPYINQLKINRDDVSTFRGSVLLLHGFRGNKEWMMLNALYFQFLGFDVYVPDLLGHGESDAAIGFGVNDADYFVDFIQQEIRPDSPLLVVGNSIGGLAAARIGSHFSASPPTRSVGIILLAPMIRFDNALVAFFDDRKPWYDFALSEDTLRHGATLALDNAGISLQQANIDAALRATVVPTLIFSSDIDAISPYAHFADFQNQTISVIKTPDREHAYMSMLDQSQHRDILAWLEQIEFAALTP